MSEFEGHTPGPWFTTTRKGSWDWVVASAINPNIEICQMFHDGTEFNEVGEVNAKLVAAAPRLLRERNELRAQVEELVGALQKLWELHLDATGQMERHSKADIVDYYANVERKVRAAIANASKKEKDNV